MDGALKVHFLNHRNNIKDVPSVRGHLCLRSALLINYCSVFLETLHAQSTQPGESKKPKIIEF